MSFTPSQPRTPPLPVDPVSKLFNATHADLIFRSCDGVRFQIHSTNLDSTTGRMPREGKAGVIRLSESSETLELLFQFIYPKHQPDLFELEDEKTLELAIAASRYRVYPAIPICNMLLSQSLHNFAPKILQYAHKFNHKWLMNVAAPHVTPNDILLLAGQSACSSSFIKTWTGYWSARYYGFSVIFTACPRECQHSYDCGTWQNFVTNVLTQAGGELAKGIKKLDAIAALLQIEDPPCCNRTARNWKSLVDQSHMLCDDFSAFLVDEDDDDYGDDSDDEDWSNE